MSYDITINSADGTASLGVRNGDIAEVLDAADGAVTVYRDSYGETLLIVINDIYNDKVTQKTVLDQITDTQEWSARWVDSLFTKIAQVRTNHKT